MIENVSAGRMSNDSRRYLGIFLIFFPFIGLFSTLVLYSITSFAISSGLADPNAEIDASTLQTVGQLIRVFLAFLGVVCVLGFFTAVPLGIYLLNKEEGTPQGKTTIPLQIKRWNWAAFFLGWIWGLAHGVWISLLSLIPIVNIFVCFYLGFKGNELAWQTGRWTNVDTFLKRQRNWSIAAWILMVFNILLGVASVVLSGGWE